MKASDGVWVGCAGCAEVYWQPYGFVPTHRCASATGDEGAIERADEEADLLNELEAIAEAFGG